MRQQIQSLQQDLSAEKSVSRMNLERLSESCRRENELRARCEELEEKVAILQQGMGLEKLPFLAKHVANLGHNYPEEHIPVFLQIAQCGESIWNLLHEYLGFPCWRTIQMWRNTTLDRTGLSMELLNGLPPNIDAIFQCYYGTDYPTRRIRVVLAVDAAGVSPRVVVHKDGRIDGLINEGYRIDPNMAESLRNSLTALRSFVSSVNDEICKDFFVVFVCPLDSENGGFPILLYPKQNGAANQAFISLLVQVANYIASRGVEVVGLAFDGDPGYLQFVRNITCHFANPDLSLPLSHQNVPSMLMFEDLLHLAKCVRYRFVCGSNICPYPHKNDVVTSGDFEKIGIVPWILDPSQMRKMDDFLPLMLFSRENLMMALEKKMYGPCLALLPMTLALTAVMDRELTRQERLDYLSTSWAFFWCYKQAYNFSKRDDLGQTTQRTKGTNEKMAIYDEITLDKGMSLFYSLSRVISDPKAVHLGALGTHWLEHFFGNVRRICNRNDSSESFKRSVLMIMMQKILGGKIQVLSNRKRLSDSGAILPEEQGLCFPTLPVGGFIAEAIVALEFDPNRFPEHIGRRFTQVIWLPSRIRPGQNVLECITGKPHLQPQCGSSSAARMTDVAGLTTRKRDIQKSQITKL